MLFNGMTPVLTTQKPRKQASKNATKPDSSAIIRALNRNEPCNQAQIDAHDSVIARNAEDLKQLEQHFIDYQNRTHKILIGLLQDLRWHQDKCREYKFREDDLQIGRMTPIREGNIIREVWQPGELFEDMTKKQKKLTEEIQFIESERLQSRKKRTPTRKREDEQEAHESEECVRTSKYRLQNLKRELEESKVEERALETKKHNVLRSQALRRNTMRFRMHSHEQLNSRYVIMDIVGKGGFSEVYKAFDLVTLNDVACKVHQINPIWHNERKEQFTRHALREYEIQKSLDHKRVLKLYDAFKLDANAFCTILEYCQSDLEQ